MNRDKIIALTNKLSFALIVILLYWVFIFISITVFGLKVFRENLTETFFTSIIGIIVLLGGCIVLNVMLNLTKISQTLAGEKKGAVNEKSGKAGVGILLFVLSFPVIFGLLYLGDVRTTHVKRDYLLKSAKSMVAEHQDIMERLGEYRYDLSYFKEVQSSLKLLEKQDEHFQSLSMIIDDVVQGKEAFLIMNGHYRERLPEKVSLVFPCSQEEREYLREVFAERAVDSRFSSHDGRYELYYPVKTENRVIVLYFTDYQRYGKIGS